MSDLNNNVDWNNEYILVSIFVRAQSTRFRMYRNTRIPCATRFRDASLRRRPYKAPGQPGPHISKRPSTGISRRVGVISSLRKTRRRPSSCVWCTFHPGSGARPVNTRFCPPRHRLNLDSGIKMACTDFPPPNRLRYRHTSTPCYRHNK